MPARATANSLSAQTKSWDTSQRGRQVSTDVRNQYCQAGTKSDRLAQSTGTSAGLGKYTPIRDRRVLLSGNYRLRSGKTPGALYARNVEEADKIIVAAAEGTEVGLQVEIDRRSGRRKRGPNAGRANSQQFRLGLVFEVKKCESCQDVLYAASIVGLVERKEILGGTISRSDRCAGLKSVNQKNGPSRF